MPHPYRDPTFLARSLVVLLGVSALVDAIAAGSSLAEYSVLQVLQRGETLPDGAAEANDSRQAIIAVIQIAVFLTTAVFFCCWTHRMSANARSLSDRSMQCTPGWAVGYYFIPIVNLWRPYQIVREIHDRFLERTEGRRSAWLQPTWWTLYIVSGILGRIVFRFSMRAESLDDYVALSIISIVTDSIDVCLDLVALFLVSSITSACVLAHRHASSTNPPPLPDMSGTAGNPFVQNTAG